MNVHRIPVLFVVASLLASLPLAEASAKEPKPFAPGKITVRTTRSGTSYAVYVPKGRRKAPLPLIVHVPMERLTAQESMNRPLYESLVEKPEGAPLPRALVCTPLLEAHNKENASQKRNPDTSRFCKLVDRDAESVVAVIDDIAECIPVCRDRVILSGNRASAEVAMGIAARKPERLVGLMLKDIEAVTWVLDGQRGTWGVVTSAPSREPIADLPIVLCYDGHDEAAPERAKAHEQFRAFLVERGHPRVVLHGTKAWSFGKWVVTDAFRDLYVLLAESDKRRKRRSERDTLLSEVRRFLKAGDLSRALKTYAKARDLESKHALRATSKEAYDLLDAQGRNLLKEADALPTSKRRSQYRKVMRLFKGTPLETHVKAMLKGMR